MATSSSVVLPRADSTATTRLPSSLRWTIRPAAALTRSASPTEVPPNFITTVSAASDMGSKDSLRARRFGRPISQLALEGVPPAQGVAERDLVRVLEVGTHR